MKQGKRRKEKQKHSICGIVLICLSVSLILIFLGLMILAIADREYVCFRRMLVSFLGTENHFDGDLWFSAVVTLIGSVVSATPGLVCGIYAIKHADRLHDLDDRYHRPMFELNMAELNFVRLKNKNELLNNVCLNARQTKGVRDSFDELFRWYIDLEIEFHIKNEIAIKRIFIQSLEWNICDGKYVMQFNDNSKFDGNNKKNRVSDYQRSIKDNHTVYKLSRNLCPSVIIEMADEFWEKIEEFAYYKSRRNPEYIYLSMDIYMGIEYEYGNCQETQVVLRVEFDANNLSGQKYIVTASSRNGYFTYDIV